MKTASHWKRRIPLIGVAVIGILISLTLFSTIRNIAKEKARIVFENSAEQQLDTLETNITLTLDNLVAVSAFFDASNSINQTDFRRLVAPLTQRNAAIQALEWIPHIPLSARNAFEKKARSEGMTAFSIIEKAQGDTMIPATQRSDYFPVYYVEPLRGNTKAVGFDLASNPARHEALKKAQERGRLVATSRISLVQETGKQYGFLVFRPVYLPEADITTQTGRINGIKGFTLGVFRVQDIVEKTGHGEMNRSHADIDTQITIFDLSAKPGESLLYPKEAKFNTLSELPAGPRVTRHIQVADRYWEAIVYPTTPPSFFMESWI